MKNFIKKLDKCKKISYNNDEKLKDKQRRKKMEEIKDEKKKRLSVPATILLTIVATFGIITLIGVIYAIISIL